MVLGILKAAYPNFYKDMKKDSADQIVSLWSTMFESDNFEIVKEAVKALICTLKFPPTIADVKEKIKLITTPITMTEMEAWNIVRKSLNFYKADENFEALPETIKKLVGSPNQLREWAHANLDELQTVIQSNFMRSFKQLSKENQERQSLPESTKQMISGLSEKFKMIGDE